jgi:hypothetical protein
MKRCNRFKELIVDSLYGELAKKNKTFFEEHSRSCLTCAREYKEMSATLELVEQRPHPEMSETFWDNYLPGLQEKIDGEIKPGKSWAFNIRWVLYPAAAMLLIVSGIIIGRFLYSPAGQDFLDNPMASVRRPGAGPDVSVHFDNLRPMLIDYSNYSTAEPASAFEPETVAVDKETLKRLMLENQLLKKAIGRSNDPALKQLMEDLEMILLELSNASSNGAGKQTIEDVQDLLEQNDILFKMKVYQNRKRSRRGPMTL